MVRGYEFALGCVNPDMNGVSEHLVFGTTYRLSFGLRLGFGFVVGGRSRRHQRVQGFHVSLDIGHFLMPIVLL